MSSSEQIARSCSAATRSGTGSGATFQRREARARLPQGPHDRTAGLRYDFPHSDRSDLPIWLASSAIVLQCHTMAEGLDWLPEDGVVLTRADLERVFVNLRALVAGTEAVDPNRSFAVDIAIAITRAIERESGGE